MKPSAPGEAALRLSWLPPRTDSLLALATQPAEESWRSIRTDPGAVLLVARHLPSAPTFPRNVLEGSAIVATARQLLDTPGPSPPDWTHPDIEPIYQAVVRHALLAERWARKLGQVDPSAAWVGTWVAAVGWLAVATVDPPAAAECWRQPVYAAEFAEHQRRLWGIDAASLSRRLARRWGLPSWLTHLAGTLHCDTELAVRLGADERLFRIVQWTARLAAEQGADLGYAIHLSREELAQGLTISPDDQADQRDDGLTIGGSGETQIATLEGALRCVLDLAWSVRECRSSSCAAPLEAEVDHLYEELARQRRTEAERLEARKLRALAEFAAGAGHEINNPLAVISVQTQQLLHQEEDEKRRNSLQGILRQTERIHQILRELMQFARPPRPRRQETDLCRLVREAADKLRPWADDKQIRLEVGASVDEAPIFADPTMIRTAISCLLRNAIEAAPEQGWTRVWIERVQQSWHVIVEDSGAGPPLRRQDLLFNPFFSGRAAGRGRGLGLPTAWRLTHENGGDVRFEPTPRSPSRFVLSLPVHTSVTTPQETESESLRRTA